MYTPNTGIQLVYPIFTSPAWFPLTATIVKKIHIMFLRYSCYYLDTPIGDLYKTIKGWFTILTRRVPHHTLKSFPSPTIHLHHRPPQLFPHPYLARPQCTKAHWQQHV